MMQPEDVDNIRIYKTIALSPLIPQLEMGNKRWMLLAFRSFLDSAGGGWRIPGIKPGWFFVGDFSWWSFKLERIAAGTSWISPSPTDLGLCGVKGVIYFWTSSFEGWDSFHKSLQNWSLRYFDVSSTGACICFGVHHCFLPKKTL